MFKISDNVHFSFRNYTNFKCTYFLQMKRRLPFWELTCGHLVYVKPFPGAAIFGPTDII